MKALVLCAGYGTRLGEITKDLPKPLLPVGGQPLLAHTLRYLAHFGFTDVAINLHYRAATIKELVGDGHKFGVRVNYSYEEKLLGTAGTVKALESYFSAEDFFLVLYGDLLLNQDLTQMLGFHLGKKADATILVHQRRNSNSIINTAQDGRIIGIVERPSENERQNAKGDWVNSGVYLLNSGLLESIPAATPLDFPRDVFPRMLKEGLGLFAFPLSGYRCAIDSAERYEQARQDLEQGNCRLFASGVE